MYIQKCLLGTRTALVGTGSAVVCYSWICPRPPPQGLSLINGTQLITGLGVEALCRARVIAQQADVIAALSVEALQGTPRAFDQGTHSQHWDTIDREAFASSFLHPSLLRHPRQSSSPRPADRGHKTAGPPGLQHPPIRDPRCAEGRLEF